MPRKTSLKKKTITLLVNGDPIAVTLHPPTGSKRSWYAYWTGLTFTRSTGQADYDEAVKAAEGMVRNDGKRPCLGEAVPSDDEFDEIQRQHFAKKTDPEAQRRAGKSLRECLDAIAAFRLISGLTPITKATPEDCERFQRAALDLPKNWRVKYSDRTAERRREMPEPEKLSANTVVKWSVALQAAFERANRNGGKKCVRGVVPESRLLTDNPWRHFTWIKGFDREIRQFDDSELVALLDYFDAEWPGVTAAPAFLKVMLWSWARRYEVSSIRWSDERRVGHECHFESVGKWAKTKWFRLPDGLRAELESFRGDSDFVFAAFPSQLRGFHLSKGKQFGASRVRLDFAPENLGDWMYHQVSKWSQNAAKGPAFLHVFRKTALQHALNGEHLEDVVARDASVSPNVMRTNYTRPTDELLRSLSNKTFDRIRSSLSVQVAGQYGFPERPGDRLAERLDLARRQGDWALVSQLAQELERLSGNTGVVA